VPDSFLDRLRNAWNVFRYGDRIVKSQELGPGSGSRQDRWFYFFGAERTIISSIFTRIGIDVAAVPIRHVRTDANNNFKEVVQSGLNNCLTLEANIDQSGRDFIQDVVMSLCDEGAVAIVPVDTTLNPNVSGSYDIITMRTGKITQWFPEHVEVDLYNQAIGQKQRITLSKRMVAIVSNPLYDVMNGPNSTLKRLTTKLNLLDVIDNQSGSGKLDLIVQLPYVIKTAARQAQADLRKADIETQLQDSKYGIAYIDGTERITQLNRPAENNLMAQIEYLTRMLYSQLGLTEEVFNGTADEAAMINYYNRTVEPILGAITDSMKRVFLTKTARSQHQSIMAIRDPFRLAPVSQIADIADKFTRNEIMSSNEIRSVVGLQPSEDPKADELRNKNINQPDAETPNKDLVKEPVVKIQNGRSNGNYAE